MNKNKVARKNVWTIFFTVFTTSLVLFSGITYYNWTLSRETVVNEQQTHVELFGNSVKAYLESQESLLDVLGLHLILLHGLPEKPIHDPVLDNTMQTYPAYLGLGLAAYDGKALVASSNFNLDKVPNLMQLKQTRDSFIEARESRTIHTGPTYIINALEEKSLAMPIRKAIYIPHDAPRAVAVMTAGIRLDNTPIFEGHTNNKPFHQVEIIRGDKFPVFVSNEGDLEYRKPVNNNYFAALNLNMDKTTNSSVFEFNKFGSGKAYQIVAHYDPYLDFWFISRMDKQYVTEQFKDSFYLSLIIFVVYNIVLFLLTSSISLNEKQRQKELLQLAHSDSLTGLPNRPYLFQSLGQVLANSPKNHNYHALLFLDIDDFKTINDTHGHEYGDALLSEAALRIKRHIRPRDTLARFGGDEFVVLMPDLSESELTAANQVEEITDKLLETLSATYQLKEHRYTNSVSIGIVLFNDASHSGSELLKQADIAMYEAKNSGKNSACFFNPKMQEEITAQFILENELRSAIKKFQFELYYQPQINQHGKTVAAEALIRWKHPEKGFISPYRFIPIAEKTGLILAIGEWVLINACRQLKRWQKTPEMRHLSISVNVSYKQFRESNFVLLVSQLIEQYHIEPGKLRIELTETMLVDEMELTIERMNQLRDLGVHFSLDDFGTGYSSLKYLKRLPLSQLKIDKSFVDDLVTDKNDQSIVKTIISMSEALDLNTLAEGVETEAQKLYLANEGCMLYQGHLYSKPLPVETFEDFVKEKELVCK
ncbi:putative bifunctional diguanylate cyclase/phosphodiesterase [Vibrio sp. HN007]|uniref:putative bifunctional diguanylate cyclase/phosphodiesterase n=1 Tax=Vibrio iocasae TaxID=3098914 RepID=UPI0035D507C1